MAPAFAHISHDCAKKGNSMLTLLALAALYGAGRLAYGAWRSLRALPRCNDDMVFF